MGTHIMQYAVQGRFSANQHARFTQVQKKPYVFIPNVARVRLTHIVSHLIRAVNFLRTNALSARVVYLVILALVLAQLILFAQSVLIV